MISQRGLGWGKKKTEIACGQGATLSLACLLSPAQPLTLADSSSPPRPRRWVCQAQASDPSLLWAQSLLDLICPSHLHRLLSAAHGNA